MSIQLSFFKGEIIRHLNEIDVKEVVTRSEKGSITFVFFFNDFQIFNELDKRVPAGYFISFYQLKEVGFSCELTYYYNNYFERQIQGMYLNSLQMS